MVHMDNNGYANRGRIQLGQRPYRRLTPISRVSSNEVITPTIQATTTVIEPIASISNALPTIPIYVDAPPIQIKNDNLQPQRPIDTVIHFQPEERKRLLDVKKPEEKLSATPSFEKSEMADKVVDPTDTLLSTAIKNLRTDNNKQRVIVQSKPMLHRLPLTIALLAVLGVTGYVSVTSWQTNNRLSQALDNSKAVLSAKSTITSVATTTVSNAKSDTGKGDALSDYQVAADLPRVLYIDKINVSARILPMGINEDRSLQAPTNILETGWYSNDVKLGQPGAIIIDGHYGTSAGVNAVFNDLKNLVIGDQITVERGDGKKFNFKVAYTEDIPLLDVDMNKLLVPYNGANQGVNLITCSGDFTSDGTTRDHRYIVYTTAT